MATIRDLVGALRQRDGVEAAVVLGRDGLLIDSQAAPHVNAEAAAAHIPSVMTAAEEFGTTAGRGALIAAVIEHQRGLAVVATLSSEALLLVLLEPGANVGPLLFEIRRNRERIAALI